MAAAVDSSSVKDFEDYWNEAKDIEESKGGEANDEEPISKTPDGEFITTVNST